MPIRWQHEEDALIVFTVSGQLDMREYINAQQQVGSGNEQPDKYRLLILLNDFTGWAPGDDWGDVSTTEKVDPHIEMMAIVGDPQWEAMASAFTLQGLRPFPIKYFKTGDEAMAREWLMSAG